jgi:sugar (pentulose or hexulose) kinase
MDVLDEGASRILLGRLLMPERLPDRAAAVDVAFRGLDDRHSRWT